MSNKKMALGLDDLILTDQQREVIEGLLAEKDAKFSRLAQAQVNAVDTMNEWIAQQSKVFVAGQLTPGYIGSMLNVTVEDNGEPLPFRGTLATLEAFKDEDSDEVVVVLGLLLGDDEGEDAKISLVVKADTPCVLDEQAGDDLESL